MIYIFLADGFEEIEAITLIDVLRRAKLSIKTISIDSKIVTGAHNISLETDYSINNIPSELPSMILLPGGMPGTTNLKSSTKLINLLKQQYAEKKYIGAICAAPMILGQLGFLANKKATCYPGFEDYLTNAILVDDNVVQDDFIITSKGPGTALEFAYYIVQLMKDRETSNALKNEMIYG